MTQEKRFAFLFFLDKPQEVRRLLMVFGALTCVFCALCVRLWQLQPPYHKKEHRIDRVLFTQKAAPPIFDRNGILLAGNLETFSVYANARLVKDPDKTAHLLCACFKGLDYVTIQKRLMLDKGFVWIKRHITPAQKKAFLKKGICGVYLQKDTKRIYPQKALFSHILGLRDVDGKALSGLEKHVDSMAQKKRMEEAKPFVTSLDSQLQHVMRQELLKAISFYKAKAGNALLLHVPTREIRAMVSLPDFNPNAPRGVSSAAFFNRNVVGVYEFGSVLKLHNVAMGLESKVAKLSSVFDATRPLKIGRFLIRDFRSKGRPLTLREAFLYSSNVVNAKLALNAGATLQQDFFRRLGFFDRMHLEVPESSCPLMPTLWRQTTLATASYGYGVSITPLHLAQSVASLVSGYEKPMTLCKNKNANISKPVVSKETARVLCKLLRHSTQIGQAKNAALKGYDIGAKTGTSNLLYQGRYHHGQNLVSCVSIFPTKNPEYVLLVSLEHPKARAETHGFTTAGWIAAPVTQAFFKKMMPLIGALPQPSLM